MYQSIWFWDYRWVYKPCKGVVAFFTEVIAWVMLLVGGWEVHMMVCCLIYLLVCFSLEVGLSM